VAWQVLAVQPVLGQVMVDEAIAELPVSAVPVTADPISTERKTVAATRTVRKSTLREFRIVRGMMRLRFC